MPGAVIKPAAPVPVPAKEVVEGEVTVDMVDTVIKGLVADADPDRKKQIIAELKEIAGTANYLKITDPNVLKAIYDHFHG